MHNFTGNVKNLQDPLHRCQEKENSAPQEKLNNHLHSKVLKFNKTNDQMMHSNIITSMSVYQACRNV